MDVQKIVEEMKAQGVRYVQFQFVDMLGTLRCMEENIDLLPKFSKTGVGVDGSSIAGLAQVNKSDVRLMPDMETFACYSYGANKVCRVLCKVLWEGKPHQGCTRSAFARVVEKARSMGLEPHMFGELEWYLFNQDGTPHDHASYCSLPPEDRAMEIRHQLGANLQEAGCLVKRIHHENGPGQNEVELKLAPAQKNADDLVTATAIIKACAHANQLTASFLPKPLEHDAGNGYHQHVALFDTTTRVNVFGGANPGDISETGKHFIAGMLRHAPEITAVFARNAQSFERLKPGHEAPGTSSWGHSNRTALVRIPDIADVQDTRIEYRGGDCSGNTYLLCAAILAAGLDGIEKKLPCPEETTVNVDALPDEELTRRGLVRLPSTVAAAKNILETSQWLREVLGEHIVNYMVAHMPEEK